MAAKREPVRTFPGGGKRRPKSRRGAEGGGHCYYLHAQPMLIIMLRARESSPLRDYIVVAAARGGSGGRHEGQSRMDSDLGGEELSPFMADDSEGETDIHIQISRKLNS